MKLEPAERPAKLAIDNDVPSSVVADETPVLSVHLTHLCSVTGAIHSNCAKQFFMFVQGFNTPRLNLLNIDE